LNTDRSSHRSEATDSWTEWLEQENQKMILVQI